MGCSFYYQGTNALKETDQNKKHQNRYDSDIPLVALVPVPDCKIPETPGAYCTGHGSEAYEAHQGNGNRTGYTWDTFPEVHPEDYPHGA